MNPIIVAWLIGEGIITYRAVSKNHRPPLPGELLASCGLFALLGLLHMGQPQLATTLAFGFDAAAWVNLFGVGQPGIPGAPAAAKK